VKKMLLVSAIAFAIAVPAGRLAAQPKKTLPPITLASSPECMGECVPCREGCTVNVFMRPTSAGCSVQGMTTRHKIWHIRPDQKVRLVFHNDCVTALKLGVGDFGPHPKETCTGDHGDHAVHEQEWKDGKVDKDPFEKGDRSVEVPPGEERPLTLTLLHKAHAPRTYKYAIMVDGKPALDPEIEIERAP
jgi:hypothetical protein